MKSLHKAILSTLFVASVVFGMQKENGERPRKPSVENRAEKVATVYCSARSSDSKLPHATILNPQEQYRMAILDTKNQCEIPQDAKHMIVRLGGRYTKIPVNADRSYIIGQTKSGGVAITSDPE